MKANKIILMIAVVVSAVGLDSCGIYSRYHTPESTPLLAAYKECRESNEVDSAAFQNMIWEDVFTDPLLVDLINKALVNNVSMLNAQSNVQIAHAQLKGARLSYLPSLSLAPNGGSSSYAGSALNWTYSIPAAVSWEVDVFGKILNSKRGAEASLYRSEAAAQATRSQLIAAVANCYYGIASLERQIELYKETAKLWNESVGVMENLKQAGRSTEAAVVQTRANYYNILGGITDLEVSLVKLNNTMSLLLNVMPQEWPVPKDAVLELPVKLDEGVPMSILACRPDVAVAEQSLASAFYAVNSARAAFYPGLTISVNGGFTNLLGSFIQNPGDWFYQLAGSLAAPIFARGQNLARLEAAKEQQKQALNNFEYTLLSAASEVQNGLTVYLKAVEKSTSLAKQVENLEKSVEYANDLLVYSNGTYLEVITAMQGLLSAKMSAINNELTRTQAIINLYQSMGGGR